MIKVTVFIISNIVKGLLIIDAEILTLLCVEVTIIVIRLIAKEIRKNYNHL